jgi:hypothetical protein
MAKYGFTWVELDLEYTVELPRLGPKDGLS